MICELWTYTDSACQEKLRKIPMASKEKRPITSYRISIGNTVKFDQSGFSIKINTFLSCTLDVLDFLLTSRNSSGCYEMD